MSNSKDSNALNDKNTVMVHKGLCAYLKHLSEIEGKEVKLTISQEGLFNWNRNFNAEQYIKDFHNGKRKHRL